MRIYFFKEMGNYFFDFLRTKAIYIFIAFMSLLCLISIFISLQVSTAVLKRQDNKIKDVPTGVFSKPKNTIKPVNMNKVKNSLFYLNGQRIDGIDAYITEDYKILIPMDAVFSSFGIKLESYSPDDIYTAEPNGRKMVIKLGSGTLLLGKDEIKLTVPPITADNHVLVSIEVFSHLDGFTASLDPGTDTGPNPLIPHAVFLNYYPGYYKGINSKIKVLRTSGQGAEISGIRSENPLWEIKGDPGKNVSFEASQDNTKYILKSGNDVYMLDENHKSLLYAINASSSAAWSSDGKYLYWIDKTKKTSYIYDIMKKTVEELGDYYFRLKPGEDGNSLKYAGNILFDYSEGAGYKRIALTSTIQDDNYTFIERKNKTVIKGSLSYSPDMKKVLFRKPDNYYYIADADGTDITFLGSGNAVKWINNNRISMNINGETFIYNCSSNSKSRTEKIWQIAGRTQGGEVFFTRDNTLFYEKNGVEKKVIDLPWKCDYICGLSWDKPFIAVSSAEDGIFYVNQGRILKTGKYSRLLKDAIQEGTTVDYKQSIIAMPDKKGFLILQKEGGLVEVNIAGEGTDCRKVMLGSGTEIASDGDMIHTKWMSDRRVLLYTKKQGWIVDFEKETKIYQWDEKDGYEIQGIIP